MTDDTREPRPGPDVDPGAFAARYGLVRPLQGRYLAGVCAALGRSTRTDPLLWRVLLPVLVCFGGVGALVYLALWLLTPEEGDTASPVEAMLGRGRSNMSPITVILLAALGGVTLLFIFPQPLHLLLLGGVVLLGVALLLNPTRGGTAASAPAAPATMATAATPPAAAPAAAPATQPVADAPPADAPPPVSAGGPIGAPTTGYRPPFAPHGPFGGPPPPPPPPPPPASRSARDRVPRERSALPVMTFFGTLVVLGAIGSLDLTGLLSVPAAGYVAAALASVGVGLLVGTWLGRARSLIAVGLVLALALPVVHTIGAWDRPENVGTSVSWTPASYAELADDYEVAFGEGTLDLRQVDFAGREAEITARITAGEIRIILPPEVRVEAEVDVRAGEATVLGTKSSGGGVRTVVDEGTEGAPAGTVRLDLYVRFGNMEVHR